MAAPVNEFAFDFDAMSQAAERWQQHQQSRDQKIEQLKQNHYTGAETKERLAKRANRLINKVKETINQEAFASPNDAVSDQLMDLVERGPIQEKDINNDLMERIIGETRDFLSVEFLAKAIKASRCVGRIVTKLDRGRVSYGTGFLVSPRLLLTNYHVLPSDQDALQSAVEFDYQLDLLGSPQPIQRFALQPRIFFLNNKELDFALVAVSETTQQGKSLNEYGYLPLIKEEGKIILKDCVNIVQHPRGELKQIVIRENELVDLLDNGFAHYRGDTEPGSSGSPAFNDQWEVIALHHSGVPKTNKNGDYLTVNGKIWRQGDDPGQLAWVANEGIRISRLVQFIEQASVRNHEQALLKQLLESVPPPLPNTPPVDDEKETPKVEPEIAPNSSPEMTIDMNKLVKDSDGKITVTIPLTITIQLGDPGTLSAIAMNQPLGSAPALFEKIEPDKNYTNRPGYNPDFLGFKVPLPKLANSIRNQAFEVPGAVGPNKHELKYYHYSVILNKTRRLAFVSAVNLWADATFEQKREDNDKWFIDPRVPVGAQTGEDLYKNNPFDRGHLTRRDDAAWGETAQEAKLANDDTFHFPNCSPQHEIFNQSTKSRAKGLKLWGDIENHITQQADSNDQKLTVFNGPIFRSDDRRIKGVQIPREYWKIVVCKKDNGDPIALAFILSQESLIKNLPAEEFVVGEYKPFQVKVRDLETRTKLDFGSLRTFDPLEDDSNESFFESDTDIVPLFRLRDMVI